MSAEPEVISCTSKVPQKIITSIRRTLLAQHSSFPLNGLAFFEECISTISILSTRCKELDNILCSGVYAGEVTEIRGPSHAGKTQICTCVAVDIAKSLGKNCLYIDGSFGFSVRRALEVVNSRTADCTSNISETLSRVKICQCVSAHHLLDILSFMRNLLHRAETAFGKSLKAVIVDSLSAITEPAFANLSYAEALSLLTLIKQELNTLARDFALAVIVVSDSDSEHGSDITTFSRVISNLPSTILALEKTSKPTYGHDPMAEKLTKLRIVKTSHTEEGEEKLLKIAKTGFETS